MGANGKIGQKNQKQSYGLIGILGYHKFIIFLYEFSMNLV
jgi:hypothetical protein